MDRMDGSELIHVLLALAALAVALVAIQSYDPRVVRGGWGWLLLPAPALMVMVGARFRRKDPGPQVLVIGWILLALQLASAIAVLATAGRWPYVFPTFCAR